MPSNSDTSKRRTLLCVDDDQTVLQVRRVLLESVGYSVRTVESGEEALDLLASGAAIDLVILDYIMPRMKGDELARRLRDGYPKLPLLSLSAVAQLPESLRKNVDASLQKGEEPETLLNTITRLLRQETTVSPTLSKAILCVEDEDLQLKLRRLLFEGEGYIVFEAQSAAAALDVFRSHEVHAVVMDYSLSGTDGVSLATELRALRPRTPIIVLSGSPAPSSLEGAVDCWYRKFEVEPEDLLAKVRSLLAGDDVQGGPPQA
jgi:CheY-like chemotaxis protein